MRKKGFGGKEGVLYLSKFGWDRVFNRFGRPVLVACETFISKARICGVEENVDLGETDNVACQ